MVIVREDHCPKDHRCPMIQKCPVGAISQKTAFSAPEIDHEKCIECGRCSDSCNVFDNQSKSPLTP